VNLCTGHGKALRSDTLARGEAILGTRLSGDKDVWGLSMARNPVISESIASDEVLQPAPIARSRIIDGAPVMRARRLGSVDEATLGVTLWESTAGSFLWPYRQDEVIVILAGEADVTPPGGAPQRMRAGDLIHFPAGQDVRWDVPNYVKKVALSNAQPSIARQIVRRIPFLLRTVRWLRAQRA
jgi:uncharacterized cupin superfamily protein